MPTIRRLPFGPTGHESSQILFGAAALGQVTQKEADETLELLLRYGINHIDTAASYGHAEERIGPWMRAHRGDFFLATKTGERSYAKAREEIHRSLERLQVETIDLIQLHNLVHPDEWDEALGENGALEAAIEARDEGLVRFIGVTGHGRTVPTMHYRALERFPFASILLPWNYVQKHAEGYGPDFMRVAALAKERDVAVQTIKSIARGPWATTSQDRATWYQPLEEQGAIDQATHWVMAQDFFVNSVGDIHILPKVLDAAARFDGSSPTDEEMDRLLGRQQMSTLFV